MPFDEANRAALDLLTTDAAVADVRVEVAGELALRETD